MPGSLISVTELRSLLDAPDVHVLEATVRLAAPAFDGDYRASTGEGEWAAARIPGSRHADLTTAFSDPSRGNHFSHPIDASLATCLSRLGICDGDLVVTYDRDGGIWAARLWWMLRSIGIKVRVLDGGWSQWLATGSPISVGPPENPDPEQPSRAASGTPIAVRPQPAAWVTRTEVEQIASGQTAALLVCALGRSWFEGTKPTRYSRRGHIPGSTNLPARSLVDDGDRLLPAAELVDRLGPLLTDERRLVLYCGGGVSACLLALALVVAGRTDVAVYDGSLEEWTADPNLPVALGPERRPSAASTGRL